MIPARDRMVHGRSGPPADAQSLFRTAFQEATPYATGDAGPPAPLFEAVAAREELAAYLPAYRRNTTVVSVSSHEPLRLYSRRWHGVSAADPGWAYITPPVDLSGLELSATKHSSAATYKVFPRSLLFQVPHLSTRSPLPTPLRPGLGRRRFRPMARATQTAGSWMLRVIAEYGAGEPDCFGVLRLRSRGCGAGQSPPCGRSLGVAEERIDDGWSSARPDASP